MKILDEFRNYLIEPETKVIYIDNKVSIINYDTIRLQRKKGDIYECILKIFIRNIKG